MYDVTVFAGARTENRLDQTENRGMSNVASVSNHVQKTILTRGFEVAFLDRYIPGGVKERGWSLSQLVWLKPGPVVALLLKGIFRVL